MRRFPRGLAAMCFAGVWATVASGCNSSDPLDLPPPDPSVAWDAAVGDDVAALEDGRTSGDAADPGDAGVQGDVGGADTGNIVAAPNVATVIVLPDTQYYSSDFPDIYAAQTAWIVDQAKKRNIQAVLHVGDIVDRDVPLQWRRALPAMRLLDGVVPYALAPGNHDLSVDLNLRATLINDYFGPQTMPWINGTFETGKIENNYSLMDIGKRKYLVLALEFGPRSAVLSWADGILKSYAAYPAILVTHAFLYNDARYDWAKYGTSQSFNPHWYAETSSEPPADVNDGEEIYQKLIVANTNVRMVFCGHVLGDLSYGAVGRTTDVRPDGTHIHQMLANYQVVTPSGGNGYLRIVEFDTGKKQIRVSTYSPYLSQIMSLPESEASFTLPLDDD